MESAPARAPVANPRSLPGWIASLPAALLYASVVLRAAHDHGGRPELLPVLLALAWWLLLLAIDPHVSQRWPRLFIVYLALQTVPPLVLMGLPGKGSGDYFAVLFAILSMQAVQRWPLRAAVAAIGSFTFLTALSLLQLFEPAEAIGYALAYTAANAILGFYALTQRRAVEARLENERLALALEDDNRRLRQAAERREQLAAARARHALARELHDSVTQTVFSMTLATESALLLLERQPARVGPQLDHLADLSKAALAQMQTLISELKPDTAAAGGLEAALRRHLAERHLPEGLTITVEVEGEAPLSPGEEHGLFAIAHEAVNNLVKHAHASQAGIRLHLAEPLWMDVTDDGRGFDLHPEGQGPGVGLPGMREQAAEIGWELTLISARGAGTRLRAAKLVRGGTSA